MEAPAPQDTFVLISNDKIKKMKVDILRKELKIRGLGRAILLWVIEVLMVNSYKCYCDNHKGIQETPTSAACGRYCSYASVVLR